MGKKIHEQKSLAGTPTQVTRGLISVTNGPSRFGHSSTGIEPLAGTSMHHNVPSIIEGFPRHTGSAGAKVNPVPCHRRQ